MPSTLARLRRVLGLSSTAARGKLRLRGEVGGDQPDVVPLTIRTPTADGADLRLLLEARFAPTRLPQEELDHVAVAVIEPVATLWVRRQRLAAIQRALGPRLRDVEDDVRAQLSGLGAPLIALDVVAVEHLLTSPSADRSDDTDDTDPEDRT